MNRGGGIKEMKGRSAEESAGGGSRVGEGERGGG